jgi:cell division protein FtsB
MITKQKQQKKGKSKEDIIFQILFVGVILFLVGSLLLSNYRMRKRRTELANQIEALQNEIFSLEDKKTELETGISDTQDPTYWEEKIRNQGYIKEGENQVIVLDDLGGELDVTIDDGAASESLFGKIKNFLASIFQR